MEFLTRLFNTILESERKCAGTNFQEGSRVMCRAAVTTDV